MYGPGGSAAGGASGRDRGRSGGIDAVAIWNPEAAVRDDWLQSYAVIGPAGHRIQDQYQGQRPFSKLRYKTEIPERSKKKTTSYNRSPLFSLCKQGEWSFDSHINLDDIKSSSAKRTTKKKSPRTDIHNFTLEIKSLNADSIHCAI